MIISIIPIGNSKGIRLPKTVIEQLEIKDRVSLEIEEEKIVLRPIEKIPREGWAEAFKEMHKNGDDTLLLTDSDTEGAFEWEW
jgi:antitoxin MazE